MFIFSLFQSSLTDLRGIPLISLWETPFFGVNAMLKRILDVVLASFLLVCTAPLFVLLALGVKLTSPGPVFFKQRRYGLEGEEIRVLNSAPCQCAKMERISPRSPGMTPA